MSALSKQRGAALVVCLIVLLVMSVIGVTSVFQLHGTAAYGLLICVSSNWPKNAAEHALRAAERVVATTIVSTDALDDFYNDANRGTSYYMVAEVEGKGYVEQSPGAITDLSFWTGGANGIEVTGLGSDATSRPPQYIIEMIGKTKEDGRFVRRLSDAQVQNFRYNFRITAIGWGVDPNAYSILQSTYESVRITAE